MSVETILGAYTHTHTHKYTDYVYKTEFTHNLKTLQNTILGANSSQLAFLTGASFNARKQLGPPLMPATCLRYKHSEWCYNLLICVPVSIPVTCWCDVPVSISNTVWRSQRQTPLCPGCSQQRWIPRAPAKRQRHLVRLLVHDWTGTASQCQGQCPLAQHSQNCHVDGNTLVHKSWLYRLLCWMPPPAQ